MTSPTAIATLALDLFLTLLAPPRCAACDAPVPRLAAFCAPCASTVERPPAQGSATAIAAFVYGGAVAEVIGRMKYRARPDLARPLADLLWRAVAPHRGALRGYLVVPVPLHPDRLVERGFNQSSLIGRRLARHLGAPFSPLALARDRDTPRQVTLDGAARRANMAGAFRVRRRASVDGRAILLVDDVRTTGTTLEACTVALRGAGAAAVASATVARAL